MFKAKILVLGPPESGKSWSSSYLGQATAASGDEYHPTQGVRILEFTAELGEDQKTGNPLRAEVELWDCGGKKEFETCWPAFSKDTTGMLLVYNPDRGQQHITELERWYTYFVSQQKLDNSQCLLFAHRRPNTPPPNEESPISDKLSKVKRVFTDLEEQSTKVRDELNRFLVSLYGNRRERQDKEELGIMGNT